MASVDLSSLKETNSAFLRRLSELGLINQSFQASLPTPIPKDVSETLNNVLLGKNPLDYVDLWKSVLDERFPAPAWLMMLIVEGFREFPHATSLRLKETSRYGSKKMHFSKTLAEAVHRQADAMYEEARHLLLTSEVDRAVQIFIYVLSEFRFAIDSNLLSKESQMRASGKYAASAAFTGRWLTLPFEVLNKALELSTISEELGNTGIESVKYRFEILLQLFDATSDSHYLDTCLRLIKANRDQEANLAEFFIETFIRRSILLGGDSKNLAMANTVLKRNPSSNPVTATRLTCLAVILEYLQEGKLDLPATRISLPHGIATEISQHPSEKRVELLIRLVRELESLSDRTYALPPLFMSINILRNSIDSTSGTNSQRLKDSYFQATDKIRRILKSDRHLKIEWALASLQSSRFLLDSDVRNQVRALLKSLLSENPTWPLPHIAMAKYLEKINAPNSEIKEAWQKAALQALNSENLRRSSLGGKNVFEVSDARGIISDLFVFKPNTEHNAIEEQKNIGALSKEILNSTTGLHEFGVSKSLTILPNPDETDAHNTHIHVLQRQRGRTLESMGSDEARRHLHQAVDLLATYHTASGPSEETTSAWQPIKEKIKHWLKTFNTSEANAELQEHFKKSFPIGIPLLKKRDGHAGNWLVLPDGRIAAIDLESRDFLPFGVDLAQLTEDHLLIPADLAGWEERILLLTRYYQRLNANFGIDIATDAYSWCLLFRALFLATRPAISKSDARHARQLCEIVSKQNPRHSELAIHLLSFLSNVEITSSNSEISSRRRITLSKGLSRALRHGLSESELLPDQEGYISIHELAETLGVDTQTIVSVAKHPVEPRFEIDDDRVRARYGHSLEVIVNRSRLTGSQVLYHGTSWDSLQDITEFGLLPMSRTHVHLSTDRMDAIETGSRHGKPILLSIEIKESDECFLAAEGTWVMKAVAPELLHIEIYSHELEVLGQ